VSLAKSVLVWAEGSDKATGKSRFELGRADEFAIYTTPPSPAELREALEIVQPKIIYVFAVPPAEERPEDFLNRLAGLCKFALNRREGKAMLGELASALAARERAVEMGLDWLAAGGQVAVEMEDGRVELSTEKRGKNPYLQAELFVALRGILNETSAYRKYFATVKNLSGIFR